MGGDDLRPKADSGLSLLCLDVIEKCDLKGGNVEAFELECSSLSCPREVSPQRVRPNRLGSQRGRLTFPEFPSLGGVQECEGGKSNDPMIHAQLPLWEGAQAASGSEHPFRGLLRSLPGSAHQRDRCIFRGIPARLVGIDLHQGNEEEGGKKSHSETTNSRRTKGAVPRRESHFLSWER